MDTEHSVILHTPPASPSSSRSAAPHAGHSHNRSATSSTNLNPADVFVPMQYRTKAPDLVAAEASRTQVTTSDALEVYVQGDGPIKRTRRCYCDAARCCNTKYPCKLYQLYSAMFIRWRDLSAIVLPPIERDWVYWARMAVRVVAILVMSPFIIAFFVAAPVVMCVYALVVDLAKIACCAINCWTPCCRCTYEDVETYPSRYDLYTVPIATCGQCWREIMCPCRQPVFRKGPPTHSEPRLHDDESSTNAPPSSALPPTRSSAFSVDGNDRLDKHNPVEL